MTTFSWVLDSGGAGRGAWQGGLLYEFMPWARTAGCYPRVVLGASAGGYAAADVATGTHDTVLKGWTQWGLEEVPSRAHEHPDFQSLGGLSQFRSHLYHSIRSVMGAKELAAIFDSPEENQTRMVVFTTRSRRRDTKPFAPRDSLHYFMKSATRKLPRGFKYLPGNYREDPVAFASHLPSSVAGEFVRPVTRVNLHNVIEASCLIPYAMGEPMKPVELLPVWMGYDPLQANTCADDSVWEKPAAPYRFQCDEAAVFLDGGFALKMPFRLFDEDPRFTKLADWVRCDKTLVFSCDPDGQLWETSMRLRSLNDWTSVREAVEAKRFYVLYPDHKVESGFLSYDNRKILRTFDRGREQAKRILADSKFNDFIKAG